MGLTAVAETTGQMVHEWQVHRHQLVADRGRAGSSRRVPPAVPAVRVRVRGRRRSSRRRDVGMGHEATDSIPWARSRMLNRPSSDTRVSDGVDQRCQYRPGEGVGPMGVPVELTDSSSTSTVACDAQRDCEVGVGRGGGDRQRAGLVDGEFEVVERVDGEVGLAHTADAAVRTSETNEVCAGTVRTTSEDRIAARGNPNVAVLRRTQRLGVGVGSCVEYSGVGSGMFFLVRIRGSVIAPSVMPQSSRICW